jgi:hypothetical protein
MTTQLQALRKRVFRFQTMIKTTTLRMITTTTTTTTTSLCT